MLRRLFITSLQSLFLICAFLASSCAQAPQNITLLHHNDFHAANITFKLEISGDTVKVQGLAGLKALAEAVRDTCAPSLWLFAGDEYTGTPISSITKGSSQIYLSRMLGIDVSVLGNHEFDYGRDRAEAYRDSLGIPVLGGANLVMGDGTPFARAYLDTVLNGVPIRIIGLAPPDLHMLSAPKATEGIKVIEPEAAVRKYLPPKSYLSVILSHMGYTEDSLLATKIPEIDVIIGGHQHKVIQAPHIISPQGKMDDSLLKGRSGKRLPGTLIVQAGSRGVYLGVLSLAVKKGDVVSAYGQLLRNDGSLVKPDSIVEAEVNTLEETFTRQLDEPIATITSPMKRDWEREFALGRWIADAFRAAVGADIAFMNRGGIRKDLSAGPLTIRDIWECSPFGNTLVIFQATGAELKDIFAFMASKKSVSLLGSGFTLELNLKDRRADNLLINGVSPEDERTYKIVTNSYVFDKFKDYFGIDKGGRYYYDTGIVDRIALMEYAKAQETISPPEELRMKLMR